MLTQKDLSAIQKLVKDEVQRSEERLSSKIENLDGKIAKVQETIDIVQEVVVKHHSKLEQRVADIEEELQASKN